MNVKVMLIHTLIIALGVLAYVFVDVNSPSAFINLFLPSYVVFVFIYGISLLIFYIHKARTPTVSDKQATMMTDAVQTLSADADVDVEAVMQRTTNIEVMSTTSTVVNIEPAHVDLSGTEEPAGTEPDDEVVVGDQEDINQREWDDEQNWTGPDWLAIYFSKRDSRSWVPKKIPALGWTVNLGQFGGWLWAWVFWLTAALIVASGLVLAFS